MVAWSNLAKYMAASDFPEFEVLACFKVFKLARVATNPAPAVSAVHAERLQRLVEALQVDRGTWSSGSWSISELPRPTKFLVNPLLHRGSVP